MTVHVGPYEFDEFAYDDDGDVLYLVRAGSGGTASTVGTPEGHAVRLNENRDVPGITIVNAKWLWERDGKITVTTPTVIEPDPADLAQVLAG